MLCGCVQVLDAGKAHLYEHMTLGQYLSANGYSDTFQKHYVLPMCAAVWSVPTDQVRTAVTASGLRSTVLDKPCWLRADLMLTAEG